MDYEYLLKLEAGLICIRASWDDIKRFPISIHCYLFFARQILDTVPST